MQFTKATKEACFAKAAIFGPSGAGKTFSALRIATGLADGKPIALIDTEYGRASKYGDRFQFDTLCLEHQSVNDYIEGMGVAAKAGYGVLIIDSLSHAWKELLEEIDKLANGKYQGNTWRAWSEGTPLQQRMIRAILKYPGHVLATMRSKTDWVVEQKNGKSVPRRVGTIPEQGKGIEYEFDFLLEMSTEHIGHVIKDVSGRFQDALLNPPDEAFGQTLREWLAVATPTTAKAASKQANYAAICQEQERTGIDFAEILTRRGLQFPDDLTAEQMQASLDWYKKKPDAEPDDSWADEVVENIPTLQEDSI